MVTKATRDVVDLSIREITSGLRVAGNNSVNFRINGTTIGLDLASDGTFVNLGATNLTVTGVASGDGFKGFTPIGGVIMFNAAFATLPPNWQLCDGTNGTPNMTDKFVYGTVTEGELLDTGGSADAVNVAHTHTGSTNSTGAHTHNTKGGANGNGSGGYDDANFSFNTPTSSAGNHSHTVTVDSAGVSGTGKNIPPYIKLAFIQRMS